MDITTKHTDLVVSERKALTLIHLLCKAFEAEHIVYCHWKSNAALDRSACGDNDLDLLVERACAARFAEVLSRLGFKEAIMPPGQQLPGVLNYYGLDEESGKLVHIHAHYQLILGQDMTKNFRLPIERPYLQSAVQGDLFKIPAPEYEYIVFLIRMVIKHSSWEVVLSRLDKLSAAEREELAYLKSRVDYSKVYSVLGKHLPYLNAELFNACEESIQPGCHLWTRLKTGQRLKRNLEAHARDPHTIDSFIILFRRVAIPIKRRLLRTLPRGRLSKGGVIVAVIGGDGAGKSIAINDLYTWLSPHFETIKIHMGKPAWSWVTIGVRGLLKVGRMLGLYPFMRAPVQYVNDEKALIFPGYPWLIREVCTARDRYKTYIKARRFASKGGIVLSDRYPLPQIKYMDGPQAERMTIRHPKNWFINRITKIEKAYYGSILPPELLIVLKVDPEIAVQRKTDETSSMVRARSREMWELDWHKTSAKIIDASYSKEEVLSILKSLIWSEL